MESIEDRIPMPPAVSSLLPLQSRSQSVLLGRDPPTDKENDPRADTSLLGAPLKKLLAFVSCVVPGVSVASCTKSRPFRGSCATCCAVMTCPREGLVVSTAMALADTSTWEETEEGERLKSSSRASSTCRRKSFVSAARKPWNSTRKV